MDPSQVGLVRSSPLAEGQAEVSESTESRDASIPAAVIRSFLWNLGAVLGIGLLLILLEARVDGDGDAPTRDRSDPAARLDRIKAGASDLRLILKQEKR